VDVLWVANQSDMMSEHAIKNELSDEEPRLTALEANLVLEDLRIYRKRVVVNANIGVKLTPLRSLSFSQAYVPFTEDTMSRDTLE
jgi:hypothetical protein